MCGCKIIDDPICNPELLVLCYDIENYGGVEDDGDDSSLRRPRAKLEAAGRATSAHSLTLDFGARQSTLKFANGCERDWTAPP